ncbi:MAG: hypothetical protein J5I28_06895 [Acidimicrobiales bacterium]|nr:hypothetical protein [Acidimicrobiales bacterium]HLV91060.1 hypothetical protein [Acidimicrobiia bacterium]
MAAMLALIVGACVAQTPNVTPSTPLDPAPTQITNAAGVGFEYSLTDQGLTRLVAKATMIRYVAVCLADFCPEEVEYELRSLILVDFQDLYTFEPVVARLPNQEGAEEWWEFAVEVDLEPGEHCVVTINQWFPSSDFLPDPGEGVTGRADLVGSATSGSHCSTSHLEPLEARLMRGPHSGCGLPAVSYATIDGQVAANDEVLLTAGVCPSERVLLQLHNGELDLSAIKSIPATEGTGLHVAVQPKPSDGTFRLVAVKVGWQSGEDGSGVIASPPVRISNE